MEKARRMRNMRRLAGTKKVPAVFAISCLTPYRVNICSRGAGSKLRAAAPSARQFPWGRLHLGTLPRADRRQPLTSSLGQRRRDPRQDRHLRCRRRRPLQQLLHRANTIGAALPWSVGAHGGIAGAAGAAPGTQNGDSLHGDGDGGGTRPGCPPWTMPREVRGLRYSEPPPTAGAGPALTCPRLIRICIALTSQLALVCRERMRLRPPLQQLQLPKPLPCMPPSGVSRPSEKNVADAVFADVCLSPPELVSSPPLSLLEHLSS